MKIVLTRTAAALALLASGSAFAQSTEETNINVNAVVTASCAAITATDVDFGSATQTETDSTDTSTITVNCSSGAPYTVEIDYGMTPQGTIRTVTGSTAFASMDYYVFQDAGNTTPWGDVANGEEFTGTGTGADDPLTAYFVLDRTAGAPADSYSDLLTVTLTF